MKKMLSSLEVGTFLFYIMRCFFIGITINNVIYIANQDSYLSIIIGFILGFIPLFLFYYLSKYNDTLNIVQLIEKLLGKTWGKLINIILSIFVLFLSIIIYWNFTTFITSQYLTNTPPLAVGIVFLVPTIYLLSKGLLVIAKSSVIMFYICIILSILPLIGLFFQVNLNHFLPFLNHGFPPILKGTFFYLSNNILPIFLLLIIPRNMIHDQKKLPKKLLLFYIVTTILLFLLFFLTLGIFDVNLSKMFHYPEFHLLKRVSLFGFIQRIEGTLSIQWILDLFMSNILTLYYFLESTKITFRLKRQKTYQIMIILASIFVTLASNSIFNNNTIGTTFLMYQFPFLIYCFFFILPFFLVLIAHYKKHSKQ